MYFVVYCCNGNLRTRILLNKRCTQPKSIVWENPIFCTRQARITSLVPHLVVTYLSSRHQLSTFSLSVEVVAYFRQAWEWQFGLEKMCVTQQQAYLSSPYSGFKVSSLSLRSFRGGGPQISPTPGLDTKLPSSLEEGGEIRSLFVLLSLGQIKFVSKESLFFFLFFPRSHFLPHSMMLPSSRIWPSKMWSPRPRGKEQRAIPINTHKILLLLHSAAQSYYTHIDNNRIKRLWCFIIS